jgi:hypothetical protein
MHKRAALVSSCLALLSKTLASEAPSYDWSERAQARVECDAIACILPRRFPPFPNDPRMVIGDAGMIAALEPHTRVLQPGRSVRAADIPTTARPRALPHLGNTVRRG